MKTILLPVILIISINFSIAQSEKDYSEAITLIEAWLEAQKDYDQLPGLSASIVKDQELIWAGAVGLANPDMGVQSDASTLCSICSISKLFTAVGIMKLYDEGKIRLDDEVSDLLPSFTLAQQFPESGPITVRSLLTHSAGLPREAAYPYWSGPDFYFPSKEEVDEGMKNQKTLYTASTYFQYSNLGLTLLGEIIEEISGMPYDQYIKTNILDPLGLGDTRSEMPETLYGKELAIGYSARTRTGDREKVKFFQANGITPAAGFTSNVLDMGKFASWQFRLRDTTTSEILKPSTLKNMQRVHFTDSDWQPTWGLGFVVRKGDDGNTWVGHGGSCPGYRSAFQMNIDKKLAYTVMINASGTNPGGYIKGIHAILSKVKDKSKAEEEDDDKPNLPEYEGYYSIMPWWGEIFVTTWEDKLVALSLPSDNPGQGMTFFKHIEGDTFRRVRDNDELGEEIVFMRDEAGQVDRYIQHDNPRMKIKR